MQGYLERLKKYATHIEICGETRNSYSKTDPIYLQFTPYLDIIVENGNNTVEKRFLKWYTVNGSTDEMGAIA